MNQPIPTFLRLFMLVCLMAVLDVSGQTLEVKGVVTYNKDFSTIPGVNITIKGTSRGTVTDTQGRYSINAMGNDTLIFTFIGFKTEIIPINKRTTVDVEMIDDIQSLSEVVIIGYGTMKKSDVTGAIVSVKAEDMSISANTNVAQMMQGRAAGVQILQQSAQPGGALKILVRGAPSTNTNNEPLYIVDGFPISTDKLEGGYEVGKNYSAGVRSPLNSINPNDIESIEILKDASSTAIYGARAANGVVLITTKRGSKGIEVNYDGRYSTQEIIRYMDPLNGSEFMQMYNDHRYDFDAIRNNIYPYGSGDAAVFRESYEFKYSADDIANAGAGTDWFGEITRPGRIQDQNISIRGGDEKTQVFTSFNYYDHEGAVINSGLRRFSGRFNVDQKINNRIKFAVNATGSSIFNNNAALGAGYWERVGVLSSAYSFPTIYPVYDSLGNYSVNDLYSNNPNPVSFRHLTDNTIEQRWLANAFVDIKLMEGLYLKPSFGFDNNQADRNSYTPDRTVFKEGGDGRGSRSKNASNNRLFETTLRYNKDFGIHGVNVVSGYSYQVFSGDGLYGYSEGYFTNLFRENSLQTGESFDEVRSYRYENRLASYFTRLNYSYDGKYILQFTGRYDGSDKFGENNKYGFFPSASAAWNISRESFLSKQTTLTDLKLRLGYGQTGNDNIGGNAFAYYGPDGFRYQFNNQISTGLGKTSLPNPNLKWETTIEQNIGLDFGFWQNRLYGSMEYYRRDVKDLLFRQPLQSFQEVESVFMNVGATKSVGWEFNLRGSIISTSDLKLESYINLSRYKDTWVERAPAAIERLPSYMSIQDDLTPIYSYLPSHIFQIGDEQPYSNVSYVPGNLVVQDIGSFATDANGNNLLDKNNRRIIDKTPDGIINEADIEYRGSRAPEMIFGFGTNLNYKSFDLNLFFHGMMNYWIANDNYEFYTLRSEFIYGGFNRSKEFLNVWSTSNTDGTIPATPQTKVPEGYNATIFQEVSFVKLKNITLGYTFPQKVAGSSIKIYIDAANLFTLTNLENMDPESVTFSGESQYNSNDQGNSSGFGAYPSVKTYTLGVSIKF